MVKILSQGGQSLADMYQVEGSIAGIEQLEPREVQLVHEMGATLFSERFRTTIRKAESAALSQNTDFDLLIANLPNAITRLLCVQVTADDASRINDAAVLIHQPSNASEVPVWVYSGTSRVIRMRNFGLAPDPTDLLVGEVGALCVPSFVGGSDQGVNPVKDIFLRGRTTAFGAGTVQVRAFYFLGFTFTGGVSSFGAHVPSW